MSDDNAEERAMEIEALESMYPEEYEEMEPVNAGANFRFRVKLQAQSDDETCFARANLVMIHTDNYPEEAPLVTVESPEDAQNRDTGLVQEDRMEELRELMETTVEEYVGMIVGFTLISEMQEWLTEEHLRVIGEIEAEKQRALDEEEEKRKQKIREENAERDRRAGTPVTKENFMEWKQKFDAEKAEMKRQKELEESKKGRKGNSSSSSSSSGDKKKLTGRQMFEQDDKLMENDSMLDDVDLVIEYMIEQQIDENEEGLDDLTFSDEEEDGDGDGDGDGDEEAGESSSNTSVTVNNNRRGGKRQRKKNANI